MRAQARRWLKLLKLRPEEAFHARRFALGLALLGASTSLGTVAAEALLLARAGVGWLPVAFLANQVGILLASAAYLKWGREARADRPFKVLGCAASLLAVLSGFGASLYVAGASLLLFAVVHATGALLLVHFHNVRGLLMDAQTTKHVLPRVLPFFLVGKVAGGLVSMLSGTIPTAWWGPMYALAVLAASSRLAQPFCRVAQPPAPVPMRGVKAITWASLWEHPFSRWAMGATFVTVLVERSMEIGAGAIFATHHSPAELAQLLGLFTAVAALGAGLAQALAVAPIVAHAGPARATVLFPVLALAALSIAGLTSGLAAAFVLRFAHAFLPPATVDPTFGLLEGSMPPRLARKVRVMKTGIVRPLATLLVAAGATALAAHALPCAAAFAAGLLALTALAPRLYARSCLELVRDRGTSRGDTRTYRVPDAASEMWLEAGRMLRGEEIEGADAALGLVEASASAPAIACAAEALPDCRSATVKARIVEVLGRLGWAPDAALLANLSDEAPVVRAEVFLCRCAGGEVVERAAREELAKADGSFTRVAAAGFLLANGEASDVLLGVISEALHAESAARAALALRAVHRAGGRVPAQLVLEASRHGDARVRRASVGPLRLLDQLDRLEELAVRDAAPLVRRAAFDAFERADAGRAMVVAERLLADPSDRVRTAAGALLLASRRGWRTLRRLARDANQRWTVRENALLLLAQRHPDSPFHVKIARAEVARASALHEARSLLPSDPPSVGIRLARVLIEDEVVVSTYVALRALTTHLGEVFLDSMFEAVRSPKKNVRAQGLEILASHIKGGLPDGLHELVTSVDYLARLQVGSSMPGQPFETKGGVSWEDDAVWLAEGRVRTMPDVVVDEWSKVLRGQLAGADPYLAAAIAWSLRDLERKVPQVPLSAEQAAHPVVRQTLDWIRSPVYPEGMTTLQRIAFLKGTEFFVSFGAEELHLIAEVMTVDKFEKGEPLFCQGEPATELCVIMKGKAQIRLDHAEVVTILDTVGAEQIVGEQGVFDGHPRSASVVAVEPVEALSLSKSDLAEVLAQSPAVAMAFLRALSLRLRRASQELAAARAR